MSDVDVIPELKEIVGALLFGARQPITIAEILRVLVKVAEYRTDWARDFGKASEEDVLSAVRALQLDLERTKTGLNVIEVANGFRLVNDPACGVWLRELLEKGRPNRLSRPALETLAVIAYRQPCSRAEIEAVRGVDVDQLVRNLMELQLVRIAGRSELPGRPWLLATTQKFLEYFGLKTLEDLPGIEELRRIEEERQRRQEAAASQPAQELAQTEEDLKKWDEGGGSGEDEEEEAADGEDEDEYEDDDGEDEEEDPDDESR